MQGHVDFRFGPPSPHVPLRQGRAMCPRSTCLVLTHPSDGLYCECIAALYTPELQLAHQATEFSDLGIGVSMR